MPGPAALPLPARKGFRIAFGIAVPLLAAAGLLFLYATDPVGTPLLSCTTYRLTGLYCPGCGTTRLLHALLHLHVGEAFDRNPLVFLLLPFVAYYLVAAYLRIVASRPVLPVPAVPRWAGWPLFGALVAFTVLRNLPFAPFDFLAP